MIKLKYDKQGLIPAIVQDYKTGEVLMLAYMNEAALEKTVKTGKMHFFSRSRRKIWFKGETSGHHQKVREVFFDCDADTLLFKVEQKGGACHKGYRSCFYRKLTGGGRSSRIVAKKIFDPKKIYRKNR